MTKLSGPQIADAGLAGWVHLLGGLQTRIATPDLTTGLSLITAVAAAAEKINYPDPALDLRSRSIEIRLTTASVRGVSELDLVLARAVSAIAADAGLATGRAGVTRLELALDTPAAAAVAPFWAAVLAADHSSDPDYGDEVREEHDALPVVWFQRSGRDEPRQRWHPDLWIDPAEVRPRIDAALAAGGILVSDAEAPSFWILADPDGNQICLCTWQDRPIP